MSIITKLAQKLNKSEADVRLFLADAPKKYKVYTIPKRKHGHRIIAQPSKELKIYQRAFLDLYQFPSHSCAMAYRKGLSIKDNALVHRKQRYLLKMDLENFFNSIDEKLFWNVWESVYPKLSDDEKLWFGNLLFWCPSKKTDGKRVLSIGAPSSPAISNFCLFLFDLDLEKACQIHEVYYTRYADDLTFTTNNKEVLFSVPSSVKFILNKNFGRRLLINTSKTAFSSKAHNRHVTGITINNDGVISLGREKKRYIKHLVHKFKCECLDSADTDHLRGLLSFVKHIEPSFLVSLNKKYNESVMNKIIGVDDEKEK